MRGAVRDHPNYNQNMTPGLAVRFWEKVDKSGECWVWQGSLDDWGYGTIKVGGKVQKAHRVVWGMVNGPIPEGLLVLHRCDNPPCVRPDHLFLGTHADNSHDRDAKGRQVPARLFGTRNPAYVHGRYMGVRPRCAGTR